MSLIGLDIGTTGCKAIVFAADSHILSQGQSAYPKMLHAASELGRTE